MISEMDLIHAQQQWANGLIKIGQVYTAGGDYKKVAQSLLDQLYGYHHGEGVVLFKPTKAAQIPFRDSYASALSYFIGGDPHYPEDEGFALTPWIKIEFDNHATYYQQEMAVVMGQYTFTAADHSQVLVEYTLGYVQDTNKQLKIVVHHSSLPYLSNTP